MLLPDVDIQWSIKIHYALWFKYFGHRIVPNILRNDTTSSFLILIIIDICDDAKPAPCPEEKGIYQAVFYYYNLSNLNLNLIESVHFVRITKSLQYAGLILCFSVLAIIYDKKLYMTMKIINPGDF